MTTPSEPKALDALRVAAMHRMSKAQKDMAEALEAYANAGANTAQLQHVAGAAEHLTHASAYLSNLERLERERTGVPVVVAVEADLN